MCVGCHLFQRPIQTWDSGVAGALDSSYKYDAISSSSRGRGRGDVHDLVGGTGRGGLDLGGRDDAGGRRGVGWGGEGGRRGVKNVAGWLMVMVMGGRK